MDLRGRCYEAAARMVAFGSPPMAPDGGSEPLVVHGYPVLTGGEFKGEHYGHAWVEYDIAGCTMVYDPVSDISVLRTFYYMVGRINPEHCRKYTRQQVLDSLIEHEHWGEWEEPPPGVNPRFANM